MSNEPRNPGRLKAIRPAGATATKKTGRQHGPDENPLALPGHEWPHIHLYVYLDGSFTWQQDREQLPGPSVFPKIASVIVDGGDLLVRTFDPTTGIRVNDVVIPITKHRIDAGPLADLVADNKETNT